MSQRQKIILEGQNAYFEKYLTFLQQTNSFKFAASMPRNHKKFTQKLIFFLAGFFIAGALALFGYIWWLEQKAASIRYKEFGIPIPEGYSIHGIDVSRYQNVINWESVKGMDVQGITIDFVYIKATEGNGDVDIYFKRNWRKSKEAGLKRGAYHFFLATKDGTLQAKNFISHVKFSSGDLPPVVDVEQTYGVSKSVLQQRLKAFLYAAELAYGVKPIIYTNVDFYKKYLNDEFDDYPLWVAHYLQPNAPRINRNWQFWQHSEKGKVNGIAANVDFNVFYGDSTAFLNMLLK
jgi:lysozyme